jgi:hypothetical protein
MSIIVIERNGSDCKYVEIFTHHIGSMGAPRRRAVFLIIYIYIYIYCNEVFVGTCVVVVAATM